MYQSNGKKVVLLGKQIVILFYLINLHHSGYPKPNYMG